MTSFTYPPKTTYHVKEKISQVLWVLKLHGDIVSPDATRELMNRLASHGVEIKHEEGFRLMLREMEGGKYGDLIVRLVEGRRTREIARLVDDNNMPDNYLPDAYDEPEQRLFDEPVAEPEPAPASEPECQGLPAVAEAPIPPQVPETVINPIVEASDTEVDHHFDLIAAELEAELAELRRPLPDYDVPAAQELVSAGDSGDKNQIIGAILQLVGNLATLVAGDPTAPQNDLAMRERLADATERAERLRKKALDTSEKLKAKTMESEGLRKQLAERDRQIAGLEHNVDALMKGDRVPNEGLVRTGQKFIQDRPHHRRGAADDSRLVYTSGG